MTEKIPNFELVVYVLSLLGGESKLVHTEEIAIKSHELFPDSFSWTKYPQFPDKDVVRSGLVDARKEKHGQLVKGRSGRERHKVADGWMLTEDGIAWMQRNAPKFEALAGSDELKEHRQKLLQQLQRLRQHGLYKKFLAEREQFLPSIGELADLLRCRVDADPTVWQRRFDSVSQKARAAEQSEIIEFIGICETAYFQQR